MLEYSSVSKENQLKSKVNILAHREKRKWSRLKAISMKYIEISLFRSFSENIFL